MGKSTEHLEFHVRIVEFRVESLHLRAKFEKNKNTEKQ